MKDKPTQFHIRPARPEEAGLFFTQHRTEDEPLTGALDVREADFANDIGSIPLKWDNGGALALVPCEDGFSVLSPKLTMLRLYMPLTDDLFTPNEWDDMDECSELLEGHELRGYQDQIMAALGSLVYRPLPLRETVVQMHHHMGGVFREVTVRDSAYGSLLIDRQRRKELQKLCGVLGHPEDDREDEARYHVNDPQTMR